MSNQWFRFYSEFYHDPKVQNMSEAMQRRLVMLFCLRCSNDIVTLHETDIGFALRISDEELATTKALFIAKGFIDDSWNIAKWDKRQFRSDSSSERVKRYREKQRNEGVTEVKRYSNALDTDTDTEQKEIDKESISTEQTVDKSPLVKMPHDELPLPWREWAKTEKYWDDAIVQDVWHGFKDYWKNGKGKSIKREDWLPSWRTWCRKENIRAKDAMAQKRPANDPQQFQTAYAGKTHGDVVGTINKKNEILQRFQGNA